MPIRSWLILLGTAVGWWQIDVGVGRLWPAWLPFAIGVDVWCFTLVYARLTGLPLIFRRRS
jgi:hypothetical protein